VIVTVGTPESPGTKQEILLLDSSGRLMRKVASTAFASSVSLSPDRKQILFGDLDGVHVVATNHGSPRDLVRSGGWANWSPDGEKILFRDEHGIVLINADGTNPTTIVSDNRAHSYRQPSWSPDGTKIVFVGVTPGVTEERRSYIYVADATGAHVRRIDDLKPTVAFGAEDTTTPAPALSPDAKKLLFIYGGPGGGRIDLWIVDADGRHAHQLVKNWVVGYAWSRDSRELVYAVPTRRTAFRTLRLRDHRQTTLHVALPGPVAAFDRR